MSTSIIVIVSFSQASPYPSVPVCDRHGCPNQYASLLNTISEGHKTVSLYKEPFGLLLSVYRVPSVALSNVMIQSVVGSPHLTVDGSAVNTVAVMSKSTTVLPQLLVVADIG